MTTNNPMIEESFRILVVVPTLGERLQSLERLLVSILQQKGVGVDILLVAKIAAPALSALVNLYQVGIIYDTGNISSAINAGFAQAREEHRYVGWIGDDDTLRPNSLAIAAGLLEREPNAVVAYGSCDYVDITGKRLFTRQPPALAPLLLQFVPGLIKQEACLFRLSAVRQVGGLDEKLKYTMDLDLLLKLRRAGPFVKTSQILAAFCWHPGSLTIANRNDSLAEAQAVQSRHAQGLVKLLKTIWKPAIRHLISAMSWKINRDM